MTIDNFCFYLPNRLIQTRKTGGQQYSDTSPFSIPCLKYYILDITLNNLFTIFSDHEISILYSRTSRLLEQNTENEICCCNTLIAF